MCTEADGGGIVSFHAGESAEHEDVAEDVAESREQWASHVRDTSIPHGDLQSDERSLRPARALPQSAQNGQNPAVPAQSSACTIL